MKLSIIVPLHNEEENFEALRSRLNVILSKLQDVEVVLVDDCSTDLTGKLTDEWAQKEPRVKVVHRTGNPGFGKALKEGFRAASGDIVLPFMGDLSDNPLDALKLYFKVLEGYDVAVGARWRKGGWVYGMPLLKRFFSIMFSRIAKILLNVPSYDVTNAFKAYRKRVIEEVEPSSNGFDISAELLIKAHLKGFKITDVPVGWVNRSKGEAKLKLGKMGVGYLTTLLKCLINLKSLRMFKNHTNYHNR